MGHAGNDAVARVLPGSVGRRCRWLADQNAANDAGMGMVQVAWPATAGEAETFRDGHCAVECCSTFPPRAEVGLRFADTEKCFQRASPWLIAEFQWDRI